MQRFIKILVISSILLNSNIFTNRSGGGGEADNSVLKFKKMEEQMTDKRLRSSSILTKHDLNV